MTKAGGKITKQAKEIVSEQAADRGGSAKVVVRALVLGGVAGLRSLLAPALLSQKLAKKNPDSAAGQIATTLAGPNVEIALKALSIGELIGDKLPQVPSRIDPLPLALRAISGAVVGGAVFSSSKRPAWIGALLGAGAAVGAAYGGYHLRKMADEKLALPDPVIALVEDAIAVGLGTAVLTSD